MSTSASLEPIVTDSCHGYAYLVIRATNPLLTPFPCLVYSTPNTSLAT